MKENKYICQSEIIAKYNFTKKIIADYLGTPDKLAINPHYHSGPKEKLWLISKVNEISKIPEVNSKTSKIAERRKKKEEIRNEKLRTLEKEKENLKNMMNLYSLEYIISKSRQYKKKYYIHCGPTNSGKTYHSLKNIKKESKGQYLAPLRLLAIETFEKLNNNGINCTLKTGEEEIIIDNSNFTSSTIELCDFNNELDILIIDEAQLISDYYRGYCYTKAILLAKAKEIHICISQNALELITELINKTGMESQTFFYNRLVPLEYGGEISSFDKLEQGDAIVVFSRKKVIEISNHLESKNIKTSILYGNLPPQNRRMEIERFSKKESMVLICTDVIGLGVSLPIKRIIFFEDSKYDGHSYRKLNSDEIVQIAGRAGRNKIYPVGKYLYWNNLELKPIEDIKLNNISHIYIPFPIDVLHYPIDLLTTLEVWKSLSNTIELYHQNISSSIDLIKYLNYKEYSKELIFKLITCPFDIMNDELLILWRYYSLTILEDKNIDLPKINRKTLKALELSYKKIELFNHMAQINNQSVNTKDILNELSIEIDKKLKDKYKK